jgi:hypothetical protein
MKKLLVFSILLMFGAGIIVPGVSAQDLPKNQQKQEVKTEKKEAKPANKQVKKQVKHKKVAGKSVKKHRKQVKSGTNKTV